MDDAFDVGQNLVDNFSYSAPSGPIVLTTPPYVDNSGGFSLSGVTDLFKSAATTYTNLQNGLFQRDMQSAQLDIAKQNLSATQYVAGSQAQIEKLRADYALTAAQQQLATARAYGVGSSGLAGFLSTGPLNTKSDMMTTLLVIGGIVLAWSAYAKS